MDFILRWILKKALALAVFAAVSVHADYSQPAVVTSVELMRGEGVLIRGAFGNPSACNPASDHSVFVGIDHPQYKDIYAAALTSMSNGMRFKAYTHQCRQIGWYGYSFSEVTSAGVAYLIP